MAIAIAMAGFAGSPARIRPPPPVPSLVPAGARADHVLEDNRTPRAVGQAVPLQDSARC